MTATYDLYLVPRSRTSPEKNALYETLDRLGWRFDPKGATWTLEREGWPGRSGRLEYEADLSEAWIQPPSVDLQRGDPLLVLRRADLDWLPR